ncbi:MAG TPA: hypothetical protein VH164_09070 [Ktedonobacteraceae bacterium]|jgi:hypothetical protein|nr:hypothetical protein [Ktedonobacteraceae bacterium]
MRIALGLLCLFLALQFAQFAHAAGCGPNATKLGNVAVLTAVDTTITAGTGYYYAVSAVDAQSNESVCTSPVFVQIPATGFTKVTLTWTASSTPNVTYNYYRTVAPAPASNLKAVVN